MKEYCVYCHTNRVNGKKYIGITCMSPKKRWANGNGYNGMILGRAIKKYGWDAFSHEILFNDLSEEEARSKEIYLIEKYQTCNPKYGYNQSVGGNIPTEHARELLKKRMTGKNNPMYGRKRTKRNLESTRKAVLCVETSMVYESISQASRMTNINLSHIAAVCRGDRKTAGGFHWRFVGIVGG